LGLDSFGGMIEEIDGEYKKRQAEIEASFMKIISHYADRARLREITDSLLRRYGTVISAFDAGVDEICEVAAVSENTALLIKLLGYIQGRRVYDDFEFSRVHSEREIATLLSSAFVGLSRETVYMLSFDKKGRAVSLDYIGEGSVNASEVFTRLLAERAARNKASSVIIAHNHPSGVAMPSEADRLATKTVFEALRASGILLRSHYVIAGRDSFVLVPNGETGEVEKQSF